MKPDGALMILLIGVVSALFGIGLFIFLQVLFERF